MNDIKIFDFQNQQVRTEVINNEPFFCVKDVCNILEIDNVSQAISRIDKDGIILNDVIDSLGSRQDGYFVNESNLYELIFFSRIKEAKDFKKWVFKEVLPAIRKTGTYAIIKQEPSRKELALMIIQSEEEKEKLQLENIKKQDIIETQEKTIEKISNIQDSYSLREASKNILIQETKLKDFIISKKWIVYLSDGFEGKKMYSTSYSKENDFAIDKAVLNKKHNKFYHQFRITKHGMDYLIKRREEISKI